MDALSAARHDVAVALADVLPGRVRTYKPDRLAAGATPLLWVDRTDTEPSTFGSNGVGTDVVVHVMAVVDGATHSAQAMREQLHAATHDALVAVGFEWNGGTSTTFDLAADVTALAVEMTVTRTVYTTTLCPPEPVTAVPIPPIPVEV